MLAATPEMSAYRFLLGAAAYVHDHFEYRVGATNVRSTVEDLLQGGSPMSASIARRVVAQLRPTQADPNLADAKLTAREQEILLLLADGLLYKEISERVGISDAAVKQHIHRMYVKLHVQNRTEAVNRFFGR